MRILSCLALCLMLGFVANAQDQSDKTLVKTLKPDGVFEVVIDFKTSDINAEPWDAGTFRVEMSIEANMPTQVLEQLVKAGRYNIEGLQGEDGKFYVKAPNLEKRVSVRGKDLEEKISIQVKTPGYYVLNENALILGEQVAALAARGGENANDYSVKTIDISTARLKTTLRSDVKLKLKEGDILIEGEPLKLD